MRLGDLLKKSRMKCNMKLEEAAEELGISRQRLSNWENGGSEPDLEMVRRVAELYGMTVDELLESDFCGKSTGKEKETVNEKQQTFWEQYEKEIALVGMFFSMFTVTPPVICWFGCIYNFGMLFIYPKKNLERKMYWLLKGMALIGLGLSINNVIQEILWWGIY